MKKIIPSTLLLLAILLPVAITAQPIKANGDNFAQYIKIDGIYYLLFNNGEATVTRNDYGNYFAHAYEGDVVIPPTVNYNGSTYTVTAIGDDAFGYSGQLTSVAIPNTAKSIGKKAFQVCSSLPSIDIPSTVTCIGDSAFWRCFNAASLSIPASVTSIGQGAFSGCFGIEDMTVDSANPVYDSRNGCNAIIETATNTLITGCQNTVIPGTVTAIGANAFGDIENLTHIDIPNTVTSIGDNAFAQCFKLADITIPNFVFTNVMS